MDGQPFLRRQAEQAGLGSRLSSMVRSGLLRRPLSGVYVDALVPDTVQTRAACLALVLPCEGVLCRRAAAWLHGIDTHGPGDTTVTPLECVLPTGLTAVRRPGVLCYTAPLGPDDVTVVSDLPVTTAARTAVDLARWLRPHMGLAAVDLMLGRGLVEQAALADTVERFAGGRWVDRARRTVALAEPASESYGESWLRLRVVDAGFPRPEPQVVIRDGRGRFLARVDLADRERRLALEYDGQEHHSSDADQAHDERRRGALTAEGWTVLVATRNEVLGSSLVLERALGEVYSMPVLLRRRTW